MTSRPGPGIQESLQRRGSGGSHGQQLRRQSAKPVVNQQQQQQQHDCIDPTLEDQRRTADDKRPPGPVKAKPVALEGIHTSTGDVPRPVLRPAPKGKPQVYFSNAPEAPLHSPHGQSANVAPNLPIPPRPGHSRLGHASQQPRIVPGGTGVKDDPAVKAPSSESPAAAPVFPGGKTADFFPWTGNHPEDVLSEALVKGGVSNKSQIMNETNTARPSLWSNLKNKSGLTTLSSLFVAVLEKRQSCGRLTMPHAFKPPPRLTLRDSTRESWLHDLANPTVGLRRLSRTIPHGITGTVLLEHCLNKNIPLPRAVWFAKCVGINEMRSHKRKGQAGTITWVRGWTSSVEQFLDRTIVSIGQDGWKPRITYALQLAACLYQDHLLEEDHFLDWILKNLDSSPPERLFLWLLIASLYMSDIRASRRRGRRLAESFLNHAEKLYPLEQESAPSPLLSYLEKLLIKLLVTSPACFLLPKTWEGSFKALQRLGSRHTHPQITRTIQSLDRRVMRLLHQSRDASAATHKSQHKIISLLDSVDCAAVINVEHLAMECIEAMPDARALISTVLDWASSLYRDGSHRVYLVTRLLRRWRHAGVDIDDGILSYLRTADSNKPSEPRNIFRVIAELVRSKTFSVGKYLQWLIATGSLSRGHDLSLSSPWSLRLITEIPLTGLTEQVRNLRGTLLRGTPHSTDAEEKCLDDAECVMRSQLSGLFGTSMLDDIPPDFSIANLSSTIKLELAYLLRRQVAASVEMTDRLPTKDPSIEEPGPVCTISYNDFHLVRSYLEGFGDLSILADVVSIVIASLDSQVLAAAADTLHYHYKSFRAIGAFEPLFAKIAARYAVIRTVRFTERDLLLSLRDLSVTAGADGKLMQALTNDLRKHDQINAVAACSPVSDTMADVMHSVAMDSDEEIDRILNSGTSMDRQIMARVFSKVIVNLEEQTKRLSPPSGNHAVWLHRLRSFDEHAFESILSEWVGSLLTNHQTTLSLAVLPALIAAGCVTLAQFSEVARGCVGRAKALDREEALHISMDTLDVLLESEQLNRFSQLQEAYRYRLAQRRFCQDPERHILHLIRETLEFGREPLSPASQERVTGLLLSSQMRALTKYFALRDIQSLSSALGIGEKSLSGVTAASLKTLLDNMIDPSGYLLLSQKTVEQQIHTIVEAADYFSLPFCQLEIRLLFCINGLNSEASLDTISTALLEAVKSAVEKDQSPWSDLISGLEADLSNKVREHAEQELLNASSFLVSPTAMSATGTGPQDEAFIQKYLTVIDFTSSETALDDPAPIFAALVERLKGAADVLARASDPPKSEDQTGIVALPPPLLCAWVNALLRLAVVHGALPLQKASNHHQAALLWSLRQLFTHPALDMYPSIAEYAFDIALYLSDSISDDVRNHLAKLDASKMVDDPRCAFVFGSTLSHDGWLALAKPVVTSTNPLATSSPQPQTQQANQGPSQPQNQQFQSATPTPLQRSLSQQHQQQLQTQTLNANRMYPQYPQHHQPSNTLSQIQRTSSGAGQTSQLAQLRHMQQMQQIQGLAQQRSTQPSPVQAQRQPGSTLPSGNQTAKAATTRQENTEIRLTQFSLNSWEILPESGGNTGTNETSINLGLFGARKV